MRDGGEQLRDGERMENRDGGKEPRDGEGMEPRDGEGGFGREGWGWGKRAPVWGREERNERGGEGTGREEGGERRSAARTEGWGRRAGGGGGGGGRKVPSPRGPPGGGVGPGSGGGSSGLGGGRVPAEPRSRASSSGSAGPGAAPTRVPVSVRPFAWAAPCSGRVRANPRSCGGPRVGGGLRSWRCARVQRCECAVRAGRVRGHVWVPGFLRVHECV